MRIAIAKITRPHGIKGEVRASVLLDSPELFCRVKSAYLEDRRVRISSRKAGDAAIVRIENVLTRDDAELMRGKVLYVDRAEADALKENEYFVDDLIGLTVYAGDRRIGVITEIYKGTRTADVMEIRGEKTVMIPYLKRLSAVVSIEEKRITVDEKAFEEVAVYED
ncbi:MAG: 16S rRNA processing protein RimM [Clostridia bacterium]|nr:16S rRNA processing protein RimM [Clostridia bacterium]